MKCIMDIEPTTGHGGEIKAHNDGSRKQYKAHQ